jgi:hypothetical protein
MTILLLLCLQKQSLEIQRGARGGAPRRESDGDLKDPPAGASPARKINKFYFTSI